MSLFGMPPKNNTDFSLNELGELFSNLTVALNDSLSNGLRNMDTDHVKDLLNNDVVEFGNNYGNIFKQSFSKYILFIYSVKGDSLSFIYDLMKLDAIIDPIKDMIDNITSKFDDIIGNSTAKLDIDIAKLLKSVWDTNAIDKSSLLYVVNICSSLGVNMIYEEKGSLYYVYFFILG